MTVTGPDAFPSTLRNRRDLVQGVVADSAGDMATIEELCAKCGNNQMTFYTMQLRSADEGQTVFYKCTKCGPVSFAETMYSLHSWAVPCGCSSCHSMIRSRTGRISGPSRIPSSDDTVFPYSTEKPH
ncbi:DNA-directed RNA polymerase I subunit RPA12 [Smittium mucronatum]|uniref:DNA-directed RNA polymerase I subunit RPA12 n=1 Tax=Smittium mucronatum TaxID=133383 RepID=A0A1R0H2M4_9FUNG|nr:DNA-directed RNA polymerase I subunit RPA12 [Smittium mucronatum]